MATRARSNQAYPLLPVGKPPPRKPPPIATKQSPRRPTARKR